MAYIYRGAVTAPESDTPPQPIRKACGTERGHRLHVQEEEPIDDECAEAHKKALARSAQRRKVADDVRKKPYVCGTNRTYVKHVKNNEPIDAECRNANRLLKAGYRKNKRNK